VFIHVSYELVCFPFPNLIMLNDVHWADLFYLYPLSQLNKLTTTMGLQVQNAIDFLKKIGALDENENLTNLG
jgi:hypothetical protein